MQSKRQNSIKQFVFKATALVIVFCYVFGPAHVELKHVLHTISHNLNAPSFVLQHNHTENQVYINSEAQIVNHNKKHHHKFLELLETVFNTNSDDNENKSESILVDLKIQKHIVLEKYFFTVNDISIKEEQRFGFEIEFFKKEYLNQLYRPPKV